MINTTKKKITNESVISYIEKEVLFSSVAVTTFEMSCS